MAGSRTGDRAETRTRHCDMRCGSPVPCLTQRAKPLPLYGQAHRLCPAEEPSPESADVDSSLDRAQGTPSLLSIPLQKLKYQAHRQATLLQGQPAAPPTQLSTS